MCVVPVFTDSIGCVILWSRSPNGDICRCILRRVGCEHPTNQGGATSQRWCEILFTARSGDSGSIHSSTNCTCTTHHTEAGLAITWKYCAWIYMYIYIHPGRLTWNSKMEVWKMTFLFKWVIFRYHVNFPGCNQLDLQLLLTESNYSPIMIEPYWGLRTKCRYLTIQVQSKGSRTVALNAAGKENECHFPKSKPRGWLLVCCILGHFVDGGGHVEFSRMSLSTSRLDQGHVFCMFSQEEKNGTI